MAKVTPMFTPFYKSSILTQSTICGMPPGDASASVCWKVVPAATINGYGDLEEGIH
ncbi:hypothetical protein MTR_5g069295 [Medicago truncatula]|uniref:Uncharacterized protein n=1 Tax=Medicago truncatula TaxID=3880 RepID=A0A072UEN4_MEDTR|nr:hypothetical protein MTR_5g069295 [Medicago truncatula]